MAFESLKTGTLDTGFVFSWQFSNYTNALSDFSEQFIRSFEYAGLATLFALLIGYPLAYVIAFRAGRWRNALLLAVIVPFFVTYLIRTLSWETILSDSGFVTNALRTVGPALGGGPAARHHGVGGGGHHLQLPALHDPAALRQPGADRPEAARGGLRPLRAPARRVPAGDAAALHARRGGGNAAHLHPGRRRLHQRRALGHAQPVHDRQRDPKPLPGAGRLPDRGHAVVPADGPDADRGGDLGPDRRHRGAAGHRGERR